MSELEEFDFSLPPNDHGENEGPLPEESDCRAQHRRLRNRAQALLTRSQPTYDYIEDRFEEIARLQSAEAARLSPLHEALYDASGALQGSEDAMHLLALAVTPMAQLDHREAIGSEAAEAARKRLAYLVQCAEKALTRAVACHVKACEIARLEALATPTLQ
jgi:hypothetical protein